MVSIISEDANDCKGCEQNSLRFQDFILLARGRLDRLLGREHHHDAHDEAHDGEGDRLAVHACIIARCAWDARGTGKKLSGVSPCHKGT